MAVSELEGHYKARLRNASREEVVSTFSNLKRYFNSDRWVGTNNIYLSKSIQKIQDGIQYPNPNNSFNEKHLKEYVAASSILHCEDGWAYYGRAINALLNLDIATARHLSYYAELRAAMSLLASEGVGIFSSRHIIIKESGLDYIPFNNASANKNKKSRRGTHTITWQALKHWSGLKRSSNLLFEIINPSGNTLDAWLSEFGLSDSQKLLGQSWFRHWGVDIKQFTQDHNARNYFSYRPSRLSGDEEPRLEQLLDAVLNTWNLSLESQFENTDRFLLRNSLVLAHKIRTGNDVVNDHVNFEQRVTSTVNSLAPSGFSNPLWVEFLMDRMGTSPLLLEMAFKKDSHTADDHFLQVLGRAFILLRMATGSSRLLMKQADVNPENLKFWWKKRGETLGFWNSEDDLTDVYDLLSGDIRTSIVDLTDWKNDNNLNTVSMHKWRGESKSQAIYLSELERVPIAAFASA